MSYVSLNSCLKALENQPLTAPLALERDIRTGWHVVALEALKVKPTTKEICAEINLLDEGADEVVQKVDRLFKGEIGVLVAKDREAYQQALLLVDKKSLVHQIKSFGIVNQSLLLDLAMRGGMSQFRNVREHFAAFGIEDEDKRFEFALKFADRDWGDSFRNLQITDPQKLLHLALKKGGASDETVADLLKRFRDEPDKVMLEGLQYNRKNLYLSGHRYESFFFVWQNLSLFTMLKEETRVIIALDMIKKGQSDEVHSYFADFDIKEEDNIFKIAMEAPDSCFLKYLKDGEHIYQLALKCADQRDFRKYKLTDPEKILRVVLARNIYSNPEEIIELFRKEPFQALLKVAEIAPVFLPNVVHHFGISSEKERLQLALIAMKEGYEEVLSNLSNFQLSEDSCCQIAAKSIADFGGWFLEGYSRHFAIRDPLKIIEIGLKSKKVSDERIAEYQKRYSREPVKVLIELARIMPQFIAPKLSNFVEERSMRFKIACKIVERDPEAFNRCLEESGFNQEERFQLALKIAEVDPLYLYQMMDKFQLSREMVFQVVLKGASKESSAAYWIRELNLSEEERYQVFLKIAERDSYAALGTFDRFEISDPERRFQIVVNFTERHGKLVLDYLDRLSITDELQRLQLALTLLINRPNLMEDVQTRFGFRSDLEQKLSKVAASQLNGTAEDEGAFQSLVAMVRPEGIPEFLQESSQDRLSFTNYRRWAVQFLNSFVDVPNQKIEEQKALFTELKELRNPDLKVEITKLLPTLLASNTRGKGLAGLLIQDEKILEKYDPQNLIFFLCKIRAFSPEERAGLLKKLAGEDFAGEMAAYEKALAIVRKPDISSKIAEFGIKDQVLLLDIAKRTREFYLIDLDHFGLSEENKLKFALAYGDKIGPKEFKRLKMTDPKKILHFALKKRKVSDPLIEDLLALFAEDPAKALLEALEHDHEIICSHISCFIKQLNEEGRTQVALSLVAESYRPLGEEIALFGIAKERNRLKVFMAALEIKALEIPKHFKNFNIKQEKYRFEAAQSVAEKWGSEIFEHLDNFDITDKKQLLRLLLKVVKNPDEAILKIEDPFKALCKAAEIDPKYIPKIVRHFAIRQEKDRLQIALRLLDSYTGELLKGLPNFGLSEESHYQIALKVPRVYLQTYWANFAFTDPVKIITILKDADAAKRFETEPIKVLLEIAEVEPNLVMKSLPVFKIKDRLPIILKIAELSPVLATNSISELDEEERYQVGLVVAGVEPIYLSDRIKWFSLDEKRRTDLFLKAYRKEPRIVRDLEKYEISDKKLLRFIAIDLAEKNGLLLSQNIRKFGIQDLEVALTAAVFQPGCKIGEQMGCSPEIETMLKRAEAMQSSGKEASKEEAEAFRSLLKMVRPEELPPFILEPNPDPIAMMNLRKWIVKILPLPNEKIAQGKEVFVQLMQLRNPQLRLEITSYLLGADLDKLEPLNDLQGARRNDLSWVARLLLTDFDSNLAKDVYRAFYNRLDDPFKQELFLLFLQRIKQLPIEGRAALLRQFKPNPEFMRTVIDILLFGHPELLTAEAMRTSSPAAQLEKLFQEALDGLNVSDFEKRYAETLGKFRKKEVIFTYLAHLKTIGHDRVAAFKVIVENILNGTFYEKRYGIPHLKAIFEKFPDLEAKWRQGESGLTEEKLLTEKVTQSDKVAIPFEEMFNSIIRDKHLIDDPEKLYPDLCAALNNPLMINAAIEKLIKEIPETKGEEQQRKGIEVRALRLLHINLTLANKRKYLSELANYCKGTQFANDIDGWLKLMQPIASRSDYQVSDTDHPNHLMLLGEEVEGSCQRITGGGGYNQGLLGYMLNGYNRAVVVTDKSGTIAARSLLRLYWDGDRPVLYQERFYTRSGDPKLKELVRAACLRRAKELNLPLVSAESNDTPYPKTLCMQGGNTDFEYVDAIGGIQPSNHQVQKSYILWEPPT